VAFKFDFTSILLNANEISEKSRQVTDKKGKVKTIKKKNKLIPILKRAPKVDKLKLATG